MSEAVEWRVKNCQQSVLLAMIYTILVVSYLAVGFSMALTEGEELWFTQIISWGFVIMSLWGVIVYKANKSGGWQRDLMEFLGSEYSEPPLDEWKDDLEERGAFEVNYESE